jgi:hypothetical protein
MQALQAFQAIQATYADYATPTEESQADKQIDHPIVTCSECKMVWRSHATTRCPGCACQVGTHLILNEGQMMDLMKAVSNLEMDTFSYSHEMWELEMWRFQNLLQREAEWFKMDSRPIIQACYEALRIREVAGPKVALAISFFETQYIYASDDENTFCPTKLNW